MSDNTLFPIRIGGEYLSKSGGYMLRVTEITEERVYTRICTRSGRECGSNDYTVEQFCYHVTPEDQSPLPAMTALLERLADIGIDIDTHDPQVADSILAGRARQLAAKANELLKDLPVKVSA